MTKSNSSIGFLIILLLAFSCVGEAPESLPEVILEGPVSISPVRVVIPSSLKKDGTDGVIRRGIAYSIQPEPGLDDAVQEDSRFYGTFNYKIFGLLPNTTYYVRAFVQNGVGLTFSNEIELKTEPEAEYSLFDIGAGGGLVFLDLGNYNKGWRYMEAKKIDNPFYNNTFWFDHEYIPVGTLHAIGQGEINSYKFNTQNRAINQLSSMQVLANMEINGYQDWFLPSIDELIEIREKLYLNNLGGFEDGTYWSSTEKDDMKALLLDFSNGSEIPEYKALSNKVIAVRLF
jgi:hypothetical protein